MQDNPPPVPQPVDEALAGSAHVDKLEAHVVSVFGDGTAWDLKESMTNIQANMKGKQLRTVSEAFQKILGGNNMVGSDLIEADELDVLLAWLILPVMVLFNSLVIWHATTLALDSGNMFQIMVQGAEIALLGANLVPLLYTGSTVLLTKEAKATNVVQMISLADAVGKLSLFRFVIFLKPQNNPVLWMVRQGLGSHGISQSRAEMGDTSGSTEHRLGACLKFLVVLAPYLFLAVFVPALAVMSWFIKLNLLSSVFSTAVTTWSMSEYIQVAGFLNQVAGMADNDRMQREAIYLFLFAGADGRWDASSFMELTGAKALGQVFGVTKGDGKEVRAMDAFRAGIVHYMVKRYGWINGVALFYAMKATHLQHFLVSEPELKEAGQTDQEVSMSDLRKYSDSGKAAVTFFQDHESRAWETPQISNRRLHSKPFSRSSAPAAPTPITAVPTINDMDGSFV